MSDTSAPFHRLPDELVVHIFRLAAASSLETCVALALVATWTRRLTLPILLRTVVLRSEAAATAFIHILDQDASRALLVENASLEFCGEERRDLHYSIIRRCPNLTNIAMFPEGFCDLAGLALINTNIIAPASRKLCISAALPILHHALLCILLNTNRSASPAPPLFAHVAHLDVSTYPDAIPNVFAHLTHLRVSVDDLDGCPDVATEILLNNAKLEMLVLSTRGVHYRDDEVAEWFWGAREGDGRLYVTGARSTLREWERMARRGGDIWEDAIRETEEWRLSRAPLLLRPSSTSNFRVYILSLTSKEIFAIHAGPSPASVFINFSGKPMPVVMPPLQARLCQHPAPDLDVILAAYHASNPHGSLRENIPAAVSSRFLRAAF
ncbi:hypothetical protein PLICRDRAFT_177315 [Plicaturopsis crispa FD-325 SS-3]|nr:hypothetical protein PLICRDRAFT_177315 [Plicaturopsis crispa FD-325 SS-3]